MSDERDARSVRFANWLIERGNRESEPMSRDAMVCRVNLIATVLHLSLDHGTQALVMLSSLI